MSTRTVLAQRNRGFPGATARAADAAARPTGSDAPHTGVHTGAQTGADPVLSDADRAEAAWLAGDPMAAIAAADRALAATADPDGRAASVAAAAAAADGALSDAIARWRQVATVTDGATAVRARGRAALACALLGRVDQARAEMALARADLAEPAPRGLTVLLDGVAAVLAAVRGDLHAAAGRLAGLAATTVPPDVYAVDSWPELAIGVLSAAGEEAAARAVLAAEPGEPTARRLLLAAWLDLRAGRLSDARVGLSAAAARPALRRNAVLAAAVTVGLARRSGDAAALAATWHRVAPVVAGAEVELLQIDVWGELAAGAAAVPHTAGTAVESIAAAVDDAIAAAGQPPWCTAAAQWWRVQRAAATDDADAAAEAAAALRGAAEELGTAHVRAWATAARSWAEVLADRVDAATVRRAGGLLVVAGSPWEAATLCLTAAHRATDPGVVRELLGAGRGARGRVSSARLTGRDGLSQREREVGRLVLDGLTQREIGARLYISPKTVEQHVARLRQKLAAANRAELVAALRARIPAAPVPPDQTRTG